MWLARLLRFPKFPVSRSSMSDTATIPTHARTSDFRRKESVGWLIQLANREGASPKRPYECFWSKVDVSRKSKG